MFSNSQTIHIEYPDTNLVQSTSEFRRRRVEVRQVRDLMREPLTLEEFLRRPMVNRGRWLIRGKDLGTNQHRQFYMSSFRESFRPSALRFGLFDPSTHELIDIISREYQPTKSERLHMARVALRWSTYDFGSHQVGIFADDLRVFQ